MMPKMAEPVRMRPIVSPVVPRKSSTPTHSAVLGRTSAYAAFAANRPVPFHQLRAGAERGAVGVRALTGAVWWARAPARALRRARSSAPLGAPHLRPYGTKNETYHEMFGSWLRGWPAPS